MCFSAGWQIKAVLCVKHDKCWCLLTGQDLVKGHFTALPHQTITLLMHPQFYFKEKGNSTVSYVSVSLRLTCPLWITAGRTDRSGCGLFDRQAEKHQQRFVATGQRCCFNLPSCQTIILDEGMSTGCRAYFFYHNSYSTRSNCDSWLYFYLCIHYLIGQVEMKFTVCRLTYNRISSFCFRGVCFWSTLAFSYCSLTDIFSLE